MRAATLLFVPLAGGWLLWKRQLGGARGVAVGLAFVLRPWTARNFEHHGRFVLVASDGGVTFWTGNNPLATGEGDMAANPHLKYANQELRARHPHLNEEQMEPIYYRESLTWIREHPGDWLVAHGEEGVLPGRADRTVVPAAHSTRYYATSVLSVGLLLPLAVVGGWRLGARRGRAGRHVAARGRAPSRRASCSFRRSASGFRSSIPR